MNDLARRLISHLRKHDPEISDKVLQGFLQVLEEVRVEDMPCSQVFKRLDEYVEQEVHGHDAAQLMPLLREHFDLCSNCSQEYEALLRILEGSSKTPSPGK